MISYVLRCSRMFQKFPEYSRRFYNDPEGLRMSQNVLEGFRIFKKVPEVSIMSQKNVLEKFPMIQKVLKCPRKLTLKTLFIYYTTLHELFFCQHNQLNIYFYI